MESTVEPVEGNKVKVSVEVAAEVFEREVDAAFARMAREVRLPGFRPGKVPRKVLEARVGSEAARSDALQHALPEYYAQAIADHDVDVIAAPEIDITAGQEDGDVRFDAVVEVRPEIVVGGYGSLRVELEAPEATDEDVDARIEHLREQFGTLAEVERGAAEGDTATIDITGRRDDEAVEGLTAEGYQYRVGSGTVVAELDEALLGAEVGAELSFTADHPGDGEPVEFTVAVRELRETVLPELDDAFASEASEFETLDELRADLAERITSAKQAQAEMALREKVAEALAQLADEEPPEALVESEMQNRLQDLALRLQAQGIDLGDYLRVTGQDPDALRADLRESALRSVQVDLVLRAVATAEGLEVDDDELDAEIEEVASRVGQSPSRVREQFERNRQISLVRSDMRTRKAMEWVLERVEIVDADGAALPRELFLSSDDPDGDDAPEGADDGDSPDPSEEQDS